MPKVLEILQKAQAFLSHKGVAKVDAEWLFADVLSSTRLDLYLRYGEEISSDNIIAFREAIIRRGNREPLQHILRKMQFGELSLSCDHRALIPRPETEELIYSLLSRKENPQWILDLGTGTGCIALSLAKAYPNSHVVAVDNSVDALDLARSNAKLNDISNVEFLLSDWFQQVTGTFDWIVSNPPYLTLEEWETAEPEVKQFDPKSALVADSDGLIHLSHILGKAVTFLNPGGLIAMEIGINHREPLLNVARTLSLKGEVFNDLSRRNRFFFAKPTVASSGNDFTLA